MLSTLTALLIILIVITVLVGVVRSIVRLWLDYRVRMAVITRIDGPAQPLQHPDDVQNVIDIITGQAQRARANHLLTGVFLAAIGLATMGAGRALRIGPVAVGLDLGGLTCIGLGLAFAFIGAVFHFLERRHTPRAS